MLYGLFKPGLQEDLSLAWTKMLKGFCKRIEAVGDRQ